MIKKEPKQEPASRSAPHSTKKPQVRPHQAKVVAETGGVVRQRQVEVGDVDRDTVQVMGAVLRESVIDCGDPRRV